MSTTIFIKTFGCALNQSDSELMAGLLKQAKFQMVDNEEDAFIIIVNTCTVKGPTESKIFKYIADIREKHPYKKVILTGCIAQTDKKIKGYPMLGTSQVTNIVQLVEETLHNNPIKMVEEETHQRLNLPKIRKNPVVEILPICEGCLGEPCAYCKVKEARGDLRSYPVEDILKQAREAVAQKIPEIWLTAQDTGCYGKDIGTDLPSLLKEIIRIPGDFKIRLGMLNPNHAYEHLSELIEIFKSDKMFKFLHIPVQSGSNSVLKSMKRNYTVEEFKEIVKRFRKEIPAITLDTDIICGFPGETEDDFYDSLNLIREITPDVLNISKFWPRPKTAAAKMEDKVPGAERKRRSTVMSNIFTNISKLRNERWEGWEGEVLVDEVGKDNTFIGRNFAYKPVIVTGNYKLGDVVEVKITKTTLFDLRA